MFRERILRFLRLARVNGLKWTDFKVLNYERRIKKQFEHLKRNFCNFFVVKNLEIAY